MRHKPVAPARRVGSFIAWWVVLMAFWVWVDDSLSLAELLAGAGAAAIGALAAEAVQSRTGTRFRPRVEWLAPVAGLPLKVVYDTMVVMRVLGRRVTGGEVPPSRFCEVGLGPAQGPGGISRRGLMIGLSSFAPNTYVLGIDRRRATMVVHQLVPPEKKDKKEDRGR